MTSERHILSNSICLLRLTDIKKISVIMPPLLCSGTWCYHMAVYNPRSLPLTCTSTAEETKTYTVGTQNNFVGMKVSWLARATNQSIHSSATTVPFCLKIKQLKWQRISCACSFSTDSNGVSHRGKGTWHYCWANNNGCHCLNSRCRGWHWQAGNSSQHLSKYGKIVDGKGNYKP